MYVCIHIMHKYHVKMQFPRRTPHGSIVAREPGPLGRRARCRVRRGADQARPHSLYVCFRSVKDRHNLLNCSPLLKKSCVRQVVLDKWLLLAEAISTHLRSVLSCTSSPLHHVAVGINDRCAAKRSKYCTAVEPDKAKGSTPTLHIERCQHAKRKSAHRRAIVAVAKGVSSSLHRNQTV